MSSPAGGGRGVRFLAVLFAAAAYWCAPLQAQAPSSSTSEVADRIDDAIQALVERHGVAGFAVGVVEDGRVSLTRGYGCADCEVGRAMTDSTVLNLASLSKPVTAWGVLALSRSRDLDLNAPVEEWLPAWPLPPSRFDREGVTLRSLLSHTAGLSMPSAPWFPAGSSLPTREAVLRGDAGAGGPVELIREPGSAWSYSGGGYLLLESIVEEISGRPFPDELRSRVLRPLGMRETTFDADRMPRERMAVPYDEDGDVIEPYRIVGVAAGGLHGTVRDLARFLTAYVDTPDAAPGRGVLGSEDLRTMLEPVAPVDLPDVDTEGAAYGLGHNVYVTEGGTRVVFHSGGNPGFLAYFLVVPSLGDGIALLSNSGAAVPVFAEVLGLWGELKELDLPPLY